MKPRGGPNESARHAMAMRGEALFVLDFLFYFLIKQKVKARPAKGQKQNQSNKHHQNPQTQKKRYSPVLCTFELTITINSTKSKVLCTFILSINILPIVTSIGISIL